MSKDEEIYTVTSISLPVWQLKWMRENVINRSALIRGLLGEHINYATGFEGVLKRLEAKRDSFLGDLEEVNNQIQLIKMSSSRAADESDADRKRRVDRILREFDRK